MLVWLKSCLTIILLFDEMCFNSVFNNCSYVRDLIWSGSPLQRNGPPVWKAVSLQLTFCEKLPWWHLLCVSLLYCSLWHHIYVIVMPLHIHTIQKDVVFLHTHFIGLPVWCNNCRNASWFTYCICQFNNTFLYIILTN